MNYSPSSKFEAYKMTHSEHSPTFQAPRHLPSNNTGGWLLFTDVFYESASTQANIHLILPSSCTNSRTIYIWSWISLFDLAKRPGSFHRAQTRPLILLCHLLCHDRLSRVWTCHTLTGLPFLERVISYVSFVNVCEYSLKINSVIARSEWGASKSR